MSSFVEYLHEVFEPFGEISTRKMFGGDSISHDGLTFALVADDTLYLKADAESKAIFEDKDLERFTFTMKSKVGSMNYYRAPEEIYDDPDEAHHWASLAFSAALRAAAKKKSKKKKK